MPSPSSFFHLFVIFIIDQTHFVTCCPSFKSWVMLGELDVAHNKKHICLPPKKGLAAWDPIKTFQTSLTHQGHDYVSVKNEPGFAHTKALVGIGSDHDALCYLDA
jgi:hypothetical protein